MHGVNCVHLYTVTIDVFLFCSFPIPVAYDFANFNVDDPSLCVCVCVCVCVRACMRACPSQAIPWKQSIEVIIIKLGTVTSSDMLMHRVLIILILAFIQGHTDLNHENNKYLIISETIQATPI